jgi:hypothetical protein
MLQGLAIAQRRSPRGAIGASAAVDPPIRVAKTMRLEDNACQEGSAKRRDRLSPNQGGVSAVPLMDRDHGPLTMFQSVLRHRLSLLRGLMNARIRGRAGLPAESR